MVTVQKNFLVIFRDMYVTTTNQSKGPEFYIIRLDVFVGFTSASHRVTSLPSTAGELSRSRKNNFISKRSERIRTVDM